LEADTLILERPVPGLKPDTRNSESQHVKRYM